ncbi:MOSC domain-containing protein [Catalinimonas niigatensis]|uniref:MOSC domain-containing protein n=1 Tax=Catalinimonas niigatensis TaxID=1397264 RepID=UPI002666725F|nr:MOSC N-terminal beta barrel domain-containing protein [Catalinimonas niigatensis]WPP52815.1 MOSC N-terminal beta barrel domain-containing protein [Catalinimonas niigatensis]
MPHIHKITLYPIKSLDGVEVQQAQITQGGALQWDRTFALYNAAGRTVNAKKYPDILKVRTNFDLENLKVSLSAEPDQITTFQLPDEQEKIAQFFSEYFGESIHMKQQLTSGFPDDDENSGPTLVSTATFVEVQKWFPSLSLDNLRKRFRANIELGDCDTAFWEDSLFSAPGTDTYFRLGEVPFIGKKPCARCTVPARDPFNSQNDKSFMQTFISRRKETFPSFANSAQFSHYYHLCVNTIIPASASARLVMIGDIVVFE